MTRVTVRAYGPLNDFLPPQRRQVCWVGADRASGTRIHIVSSSKDAIVSALLPRTRAHFERFQECGGCGRIPEGIALDAARAGR